MSKNKMIISLLGIVMSSLAFCHLVEASGSFSNDGPKSPSHYDPRVQVVYSLTPPPDEPAKFREGITTDDKLRVDEPFYVMINAAIKASGPFTTNYIDCILAFSYPHIIKVTPIQRQVELRELDYGTRYAFRIPVKKTDDEVIRIVFKCEPQTAGTQNIRVSFDKNVASHKEQSYDCLIKAAYYVAIDSQPDGSYDEDELKEMIQQGVLKPETLVVAWGNTEWVAAKTVPKLAAFFKNVPPPVPQ